MLKIEKVTSILQKNDTVSLIFIEVSNKYILLITRMSYAD